MSGEGWIKLHRKSIDSQVFQNADLWKLWTLCLLKANHKESWVAIPGITEPVKVLPGQFITGRYSLHKEFYPPGKSSGLYKSPISLWRWLKKLENMRNLNIKTNNKFSIVSIINWESYQNDGLENEQVNEQQMNNRRTTDEQQMNTNKNVKNVKNVKKKRHARVRKEFIPPTLNEVKSYFKEKGYSEEAADKAFSYYDAADWVDSQGNKVRNWKQKMIAVWFKEENKTTEETPKFKFFFQDDEKDENGRWIRKG